MNNFNEHRFLGYKYFSGQTYRRPVNLSQIGRFFNSS